jgi:hypothetical protein
MIRVFKILKWSAYKCLYLKCFFFAGITQFSLDHWSKALSVPDLPIGWSLGPQNLGTSGQGVLYFLTLFQQKKNILNINIYKTAWEVIDKVITYIFIYKYIYTHTVYITIFTYVLNYIHDYKNVCSFYHSCMEQASICLM